jgi:hypothetical protein
MTTSWTSSTGQKHNILNHTSLIVLVLTGMLLLGMIGGMVYPYKTIDITKFRVERIDNRPLGVGYISTICWSFNKYINKPALYAISLVPIKGTEKTICYGLESGGVNSERGYHETCKPVKITEEVEPGEYKVRMSVTYRVNPIREITRVFYTDNTLIIR